MSNQNEKGFQNYLSIETAGGARWHPNEQKIVFVYDAPGIYQLYSTQVTEGHTIWPTRLSFDTNRCTNPRYLNDSTIIFARDIDGDENFQIFCLEKDLKLHQISTDVKAKYLVMLASDNYIYFMANTENKARFDVYRQKIPLKDNQAEKIYESPSGSIPIPKIASTDQKKIVIQLMRGNMFHEILLIDIGSKSTKNLTTSISGKEEVRWNPVRLIDDTHILVVTDYKSDLNRLAIISTDGDFFQIENLEGKSQYEISNVSWTKESPYTYFTYNEEGYSVLYKAIFSTTGVDKLQQIALPLKGVIPSGDTRSFTQGLSVSPDGTMLAITLSSPSSPTNIWIINLENNKMWKATNVGTAGLDPNRFVDTSLEEFASFDRLKIPYFRYLPHGDKPSNGWPAIFIIHGGPEAQMLPNFYPQIQFFLSAGFAIIAPNIRGSTGYGRTYLDLDNKEKRLDSIKDIKHLALHIKENDPDINGDKLIVYGGSYGGFAVLSAMTEHPDLWAAGVDIVGISNFVTFLQNTAPWRRKLREVEYGSLEEDLEMLKRISPINKIDNISAPLFIIHGDNDERVPLSETIQIYDKLKEKGLEVELLRFADEGHGLAKLENKIKAYSEVIKWLKKVI
ncbi:MAG: prolyl oligopeptidase family serine peptidase [Candidatus Hermodarchaeota archaeon]